MINSGGPVFPPAAVNDRRFRVLLVLYVLLLLGVVAYAYGHRHRSAFLPLTAAAPQAATSNAAAPNDVVAVVNGDVITRQEADAALDDLDGAQVVQRLVSERAILQAAAQAHVHLDDEESNETLDRLNQRVKDPSHFAVEENSLRARLLLRHMILQHVPLSRLLKIYSEFKDELSMYQMSEIRVSSAADASKVEAELRQGDPFDKVLQRWSKDRAAIRRGGLVGFMTLAQIENRYGVDGVKAIYRHLEGRLTASDPVVAGFGLVILQIGQVRSDFHDLKPFIEDIVVAAEAPSWLYQTMSQADVQFPIHALNLKNNPVAAPGPSQHVPDGSIYAPPSAVPLPKHSPGFLTLPSAIKATHVFALPAASKGKANSIFAEPSARKGGNADFPNPYDWPSTGPTSTR